MKIKLPTRFEVNYPKKNRKYYSSHNKPIIAKILYESSRGYCMYCGKTIHIEGDEIYHVEHSVDKASKEYTKYDPHEVLKHCKFNLAVVCSECNTVCKKMVDKANLEQFAPLPKCPKTCVEMCDMYREIRNDYMNKNAIILQPLGKEEPTPYLIAYNLLKHIYEPDCPEENEEAVFFIQNHIDRFELNGRRFSSNVIDISCKIVLWYEKGITSIDALMECLRNEKHFNVLGERFVDFIEETFADKPSEKLVRFCKLLVILDAVP